MSESISSSDSKSAESSAVVAKVAAEVLPPIRVSPEEMFVTTGRVGLEGLVWHSPEISIPGVETREDGAVTSVNGVAVEPFSGNETGQRWD